MTCANIYIRKAGVKYFLRSRRLPLVRLNTHFSQHQLKGYLLKHKKVYRLCFQTWRADASSYIRVKFQFCHDPANCCRSSPKFDTRKTNFLPEMGSTKEYYEKCKVDYINFKLVFPKYLCNCPVLALVSGSINREELSQTLFIRVSW